MTEPQKIEECINRQFHGNPYRYCYCGWIEEPPAVADLRTEVHTRISNAISQRIDLARGGSSATVGELADAVMELFVDVRRLRDALDNKRTGDTT